MSSSLLCRPTLCLSPSRLTRRSTAHLRTTHEPILTLRLNGPAALRAHIAARETAYSLTCTHVSPKLGDDKSPSERIHRAHLLTPKPLPLSLHCVLFSLTPFVLAPGLLCYVFTAVQSMAHVQDYRCTCFSSNGLALSHSRCCLCARRVSWLSQRVVEVICMWGGISYGAMRV